MTVTIHVRMDAFFSQRCVTADARPADASPWSIAARSELALVQEQRGAFGASRAVLASVLAMVAKCRKTAKVLLIALDTPSVAPVGADIPADKLVVHDYSTDMTLFRSLLDESNASPLVDKLQHDVDAFTASNAASSRAESPALSSRPLVVAIDSLNVLLQSHSLAQVLIFIKGLRASPLIGAVVARVDASAEPEATTLALAAAATAIVTVETRSSLNSYSVLAVERRREVPRSMDGLVQLVRLQKNARVSESIEFFQVAHGVVSYFDVPQADVSFSLTMSAQEQDAKSKVQLPYVHQGQAEATNALSIGGTDAGGAGNLLFIDEDDLDWDDDDLDDDLGI